MSDWKSKFFDMAFPFNAKDESMSAAFMLKHENLPNAIYKYRQVDDYSKKNLKDGMVWLADPSTFNDPYDCAHSIDMTKMVGPGFNIPVDILDRLPPGIDRTDLVSSVAISHDPISTLVEKFLHAVPRDKRNVLAEELKSAVKEVFEEFMDETRKKVKSSFKVCSFSERMDSLLMWAHYSNNHKGFCIEYDIKSLAPDDLTSRFLYPVIYTDLLFDVTAHVDRGVADPSFNNLYWNRAGLYKAKDWSYESEWRLVFANGIMKNPHGWPMPKAKNVFLGSHISKSDQNDIVRICEDVGIPVKKMKISSDEFRMISTEI